jgi:NO-binding membrane sensor protein with MHYT domain
VTTPWPSAPAKPPISGTDLTISIVSLALTLLLGASAAVMGFFLLAFLDNCPPETCSAGGAVTAVGVSLIVAVVVGLVGLVVTIVQLVRRRPAWPFAVSTLVLCGVICAFGFAGYFAAVGAGRV